MHLHMCRSIIDEWMNECFIDREKKQFSRVYGNKLNFSSQF